MSRWTPSVDTKALGRLGDLIEVAGPVLAFAAPAGSCVTSRCCQTNANQFQYG